MLLFLAAGSMANVLCDMQCSANNKLTLSHLLALYFAYVICDLQVRTTRWRHRGLTPMTPVVVLATYYRRRVIKENNFLLLLL